MLLACYCYECYASTKAFPYASPFPPTRWLPFRVRACPSRVTVRDTYDLCLFSFVLVAQKGDIEEAFDALDTLSREVPDAKGDASEKKAEIRNRWIGILPLKIPFARYSFRRLESYLFVDVACWHWSLSLWCRVMLLQFSSPASHALVNIKVVCDSARGALSSFFKLIFLSKRELDPGRRRTNDPSGWRISTNPLWVNRLFARQQQFNINLTADTLILSTHWGSICIYINVLFVPTNGTKCWRESLDL